MNKKAVALNIDSKEKIPKILAKAKGQLVKQLIEIADNNNIEVYKDSDLVETLDAFEVGQIIPEDLYKTIAEILVYSYNINDDLKEKYKEGFFY